MKVRFSLAMLSCAGVVCLGTLVGCGQQGPEPRSPGEGPVAEGGAQQEDVDPHDVPITDEQKEQLREATAKFADAIGQIKQLRDAVEAETKDGLPDNPFEAHQALDKADLVFQWLPEIARDSGVPKEQWEAVNVAANDLRDLFERVHQNIDDKADPDFASVSAQIEKRLGELEAIAQAQPTVE